MSDNLRGMLWILASVMGATGMSLSVRGLAGHVPVVEIVAVRCVIGLALATGAAWWFRSGPIWSERWHWHLLRAFLILGALSFGYTSLMMLPLSTATVLFFTAPLWVTVISIPVFGEKVGWRRALAMAAGFFGVVVVLRPSPEGIDATMLIPLASSMCFALSLLIGKHLSKSDPAGVLMIYAMGLAVVVATPIAILDWVPPSASDWALLISVSLFGSLRAYADIRGYAIGEPAVLTSVQYTRLIFIAIGAYVFYLETPDRYTIIGASVIVASTLYIARRESKLAREGRIKKAAAVAGP